MTRWSAPTAATSASLPFSVVEIAGKGHGCVARRTIGIGERIIADPPLVVQGPGMPSLQAACNAMTPQAAALYFALTQNVARFGETKHITGIFATNGIPFVHKERRLSAIFPVVARFNHSCDSNATYKYNETLGKLTVHACKQIRPNEEICVSYGFPASCLQREQRQQRLC